MTLMPVTRIAASVDWSTNSGASAWIGADMSLPIGPRSSIGSPMTFMMRPSVFGPTGTRICEPVSVTSWPRVRPSVESMAIVRTVFSPRCWATSSTRRLPLLSVSSAERIAGSSPSKATSTTAPMTWPTRPTRLLVCAVAVAASRRRRPSARLLAGLGRRRRWPWSVFLAFVVSLERFGARDDFDEFGGDRGLALRLYWIVRWLIMSPALRVALSIAVICDALIRPAFSSSARKIWTAMLRGSRSARISSSSGSYSTAALRRRPASASASAAAATGMIC